MSAIPPTTSPLRSALTCTNTLSPVRYPLLHARSCHILGRGGRSRGAAIKLEVWYGFARSDAGGRQHRNFTHISDCARPRGAVPCHVGRCRATSRSTSGVRRSQSDRAAQALSGAFGVELAHFSGPRAQQKGLRAGGHTPLSEHSHQKSKVYRKREPQGCYPLRMGVPVKVFRTGPCTLQISDLIRLPIAVEAPDLSWRDEKGEKCFLSPFMRLSLTSIGTVSRLIARAEHTHARTEADRTHEFS